MAFRLKAPDADRLMRAASGRGLDVSAFVRGTLLDTLDGVDRPADVAT